MSVSSRAPTRISFAGGGTDVEPFVSEYEGAVLNVAISKYNYVSIMKSDKFILRSPEFLAGLEIDPNHIEYNRNLDLLKAAVKVLLDKPAKVSIFSEIPYRSGLGSSGSAFSATIMAIYEFLNKRIPSVNIAELAWKIEREELKNIGGKQDQYTAVFGGFNFLEFEKDGVIVNNLKIDKNIYLELEKRIIITYVAPRETSGDILEEQIKNVSGRKGKTVDALLQTKSIAYDMKKELVRGNIESMAELIKEAWKLKKQFSSKISSRYIDKIYDIALENGALTGKISGAGGGGYMFFIAEEGKEINLSMKLKEIGLNPEGIKFDFNGAVSWRY